MALGTSAAASILLDNLLQRALILVNGPVIRPEHIQFELANENHAPATPTLTIATSGSAAINGSSKPTTGQELPGTTSNNSLASSLDQTERDLILDALRFGQGSRREAAERLGISQRTLRYKLARLREAGIDVPAA